MEEGVAVWVRDAKASDWRPAVLAAQAVQKNSTQWEVKVLYEGTDAPVTVTSGMEPGHDLKDIKLRNTETGFDDVEDLTRLPHLHEPAILHVLQQRYRNGLIYTFTGHILLAINPFQVLPLYTKERLEAYYSHGLLKAAKLAAEELAPHVYSVADRAYRQMMDVPMGSHASRNQSMLVSGESGAGKTETTKIIMQYLATVGRARSPSDGTPRRASTVSEQSILAAAAAMTPSRAAGGPATPASSARRHEDLEATSEIEDRVLMSNPILECFGNAKTLRNDNSSRFGKFIELQFSRRGQMVGARIQTYLLEKVRLASQAKGERNYHAFYQLCKGASPEVREAYRLGDMKDYRLLCKSGEFNIRDGDDAVLFNKTCAAMRIMGFHESEIDQVFQVIAALLHLGNITFIAGDGDSGSRVQPEDMPLFEFAAGLLGLNVAQFQKALTSKRLSVRGEVTFQQFTPAVASDTRDAVSKAVYGLMFNWIVARINDSIRNDAQRQSFIGVLDIFGFEAFQYNSFEQLCINYANETLQQHFNQFIFKQEQAEYQSEGIPWDLIQFQDNQECLDLIEARAPPGIITLMDEQCLMPNSSDGQLARKLHSTLASHPRFSADPRQKANNEFVVIHYAGEVCYNCAGFLEKNKDQLHADAQECLSESSCDLIAAIMSRAASAVAQVLAASQTSGATGAGRAASKSSLLAPTLGTQFKQQLGSLMTAIRATSPHYIRCIKPNSRCVPDAYDRPAVVAQLRCQGVLEAVRVARMGFPVRLVHSVFNERYHMLGTALRDPSMTPESRSDALVSRLGLPEGVCFVGRSKVFMKQTAHDTLESMRAKALRVAAIMLQAHARRFLARAQWKALQMSTRLLQRVGRGMLARSRTRRIRQHHASIRLQRVARGHMARSRYVKLREALIRLQSRMRGLRARAHVTELRQHRAATHMQRIWRGRKHRATYHFTRKAAVKLQSHIRSWRARQTLATLRREARDIGNLKEMNVKLALQVTEMTHEMMELRRLTQELADWKAQTELELAARAAAPPSTDPAVMVASMAGVDPATSFATVSDTLDSMDLSAITDSDTKSECVTRMAQLMVLLAAASGLSTEQYVERARLMTDLMSIAHMVEHGTPLVQSTVAVVQPVTEAREEEVADEGSTASAAPSQEASSTPSPENVPAAAAPDLTSPSPGPALILEAAASTDSPASACVHVAAETPAEDPTLPAAGGEDPAAQLVPTAATAEPGPGDIVETVLTAVKSTERLPAVPESVQVMAAMATPVPPPPPRRLSSAGSATMLVKPTDDAASLEATPAKIAEPAPADAAAAEAPLETPVRVLSMDTPQTTRDSATRIPRSGPAGSALRRRARKTPRGSRTTTIEATPAMIKVFQEQQGERFSDTESDDGAGSGGEESAELSAVAEALPQIEASAALNSPVETVAEPVKAETGPARRGRMSIFDKAARALAPALAPRGRASTSDVVASTDAEPPASPALVPVPAPALQTESPASPAAKLFSGLTSALSPTGYGNGEPAAAAVLADSAAADTFAASNPLLKSRSDVTAAASNVSPTSSPAPAAALLPPSASSPSPAPATAAPVTSRLFSLAASLAFGSSSAGAESEDKPTVVVPDPEPSPVTAVTIPFAGSNPMHRATASGSAALPSVPEATPVPTVVESQPAELTKKWSGWFKRGSTESTTSAPPTAAITPTSTAVASQSNGSKSLFSPENSLAKYKTQIKDQQDQISQQATQLQQSAAERASLRAQIDDLQNSMRDRDEVLAQLETALHLSNEARTQREEQFFQVTEELSSAKSQVSNLAASVEQLKAAVAAMEERLREASSKNMQLAHQLESKQVENRDLLDKMLHMAETRSPAPW